MLSLEQKKVLVVGMGRSGNAAATLLRRHGAVVTCNDSRGAEAFGVETLALSDQGIDMELGKSIAEVIEGQDMVVLSPGVPFDLPVLQDAVRRGVPVIGETELGFCFTQAPIVAITGTNGKTTTTMLTAHIFSRAGYRTWAAGNVGLPLSEIADESTPEDRIVLEASSFQMETIDTFRPAVSAVLNITEDHLNRHHTMENYVAAKMRICENQRGDDVLILNADQPDTAVLNRYASCRVMYFSHEKEVESGCCVVDEKIVYRPGDGTEIPIMRPGEIRIPGTHNLENALAAITIAMSMGVPAQVVRHAVATFQGVEHRIERVDTVRGVMFINDSKGTNPDASIRAVQAMQSPTVLIAGGSEKNNDFRPLIRAFTDKIKAMVLIGETAPRLQAAAEEEHYQPVYRAGSLEEAMRMALEMSDSGGNVLLSPACASFDMFDNYEHRGQVFKELVEKLKKEYD